MASSQFSIHNSQFSLNFHLSIFKQNQIEKAGPPNGESRYEPGRGGTGGYYYPFSAPLCRVFHEEEA